MPKHYSTLPQFNAHLPCAVDLETTGTDPTIHEIIQFGFVPLDMDYTAHKVLPPFYITVAPDHPELAMAAATRVHGLDLDDLVKHSPSQSQALEMFDEWYERLDLAFQRKLIMFAHNASFEQKFLLAWLGQERYDSVFAPQTRDSMTLALAINDVAIQRGSQVPFERVSLGWLSDHLGINNARPHDAYADATAGALVYRELIKMDVIL